MPSRFLIALATCGALAGSFWVGRLSMGIGKVTTVAADDAMTELRQELTAMTGAIDGLKRSLSRGGERATPQPLVAQTATAPCPPSDRQARRDELERAEIQREDPRLKDGAALVTAAMDRGTWSASDIERFRELARAAPDLDWVPLMQQIDQAINSGRVRPDPDLLDFH